MIEYFHPKVGELVEVFPREGRFHGLFEITGVHDGDGRSASLLDLKRCKDGRLEKGIPAYLVDYPKEERVRRVLEKILSESDSWPEDFQRNRFEVFPDEMFDGTPRVMIYFYFTPESIPSLERAGVWNNFYSKLREKLQSTMEDVYPEHHLQFTAKQERSALSAAS